MKVCGVAVARLQGHSWAPTLSNGWKVNVGTIPPVPHRPTARWSEGEARCRLMPVGWGGGPEVSGPRPGKPVTWRRGSSVFAAFMLITEAAGEYRRTVAASFSDPAVGTCDTDWLHQSWHEHMESRMQWKLHVRITRAGRGNPPAEKLTGRPGPTPTQHREPGRALNQRSDRGTVHSQDQITFPVSRHCPVVSLGRSFADHDLRCDELAAPLAGPCPGNPQRSPGSQTRHKLAF